MARSKRSSDGLPRRAFLKQGVALLGAGGLGAASVAGAEAAGPPDSPPWMKSPGAGMSEYGSPAKHEAHVKRAAIASRPGTTGSGASRTPLEALDGMITPSGLHFAGHHSRVPDIDPSQLRLPIHGMVRPPLPSTGVPMAKAMDDTLLALFQNGERLRPENGYPVRLFLLGYEGNMNVKWLRRIKVTSTPTMTKDETSRYTDLQGDGKALMFTYPMEVKSVITRPSHGMTLRGAGLHQISGIAWSGNGTIRQVDVSTDGGRTWTEAPLVAPVLPRDR